MAMYTGVLENTYSVVVVVVVYFLNCKQTYIADKYIFSGVQFVVIPSEHYSCDL